MKFKAILFNMAILTAFISFFWFSLPAHVQPADIRVKTLRCGNKVISLGDRAYKVREQCGEPDYVDKWLEERIVNDFLNPYSKRRRELDKAREPLFTKKYVTVEEWTYDAGPSKFTRHLIFENGILQEIHLGEY